MAPSAGKMGGKKIRLPSQAPVLPAGYPPAGTRVRVVEIVDVDKDGKPLSTQGSHRWMVVTDTFPPVTIKTFESVADAYAFVHAMNYVP